MANDVSSQPIIDFRELSAYPGGSGLEALTRMIGERMGLSPLWTGLGPDRGRDLIFNETEAGRLGHQSVRWLVSCKDFSESGRSVNERDMGGSIVDKATQHGCSGFLLVTSTVPSSGLKDMLDEIQASGRVKTVVWDRHELTSLLLNRKNRDLFEQFFPRSYEQRSESQQKLKAAIATYKRQVEAKFGLPHYESIDGPEYSTVRIVDDQIPGYSVDLEFPQFAEGGTGSINEVNLMIRAKMLGELHRLREASLLSRYDLRREAKEHWESVRASVAASTDEVQGDRQGEVTPISSVALSESVELDQWNSALIVDYDVTLLTSKLVSVRFNYYHSSASAAHPNHWTEVVNYQLNPALPLSIGSLFVEGTNFVERLSDLCIRAITKRKLDDAEWTAEIDVEKQQDFADDLPSELSAKADKETIAGAGPSVEHFEKYCLTKEGLVVNFDEYAVDCYVAGMYQAVIRYSALADVLNPKCAVSTLAP